MRHADLIGKKEDFAIKYLFFKETNETEIELFIDGKNILEYVKNGIVLSTRWNISHIVKWLKAFLNHFYEDPYPVECVGEYAAMKDITARDFDSDDDDAFFEYYNKLYEWNVRHRWHDCSEGAILSNLYFQVCGNNVEISWNNQNSEEGVVFTNILGGKSISKDLFLNVIGEFINRYDDFWAEMS